LNHAFAHQPRQIGDGDGDALQGDGLVDLASRAVIIQFENAVDRGNPLVSWVISNRTPKKPSGLPR